MSPESKRSIPRARYVAAGPGSASAASGRGCGYDARQLAAGRLVTEAANGCWLIGASRLAETTPSRHVFRLLNGDPGPYLVCHTCRNSACVNPDHLYKKTHCVHGQPLEDARVRPGSGRQCRECARLRMRRRWRERRAVA